MEKQKRILNFSEFTNAYAKGDNFAVPGNTEDSVEKLQDKTKSLASPIVPGSKGEMDSISNKPATKKLKTDYELSPPIPNGPVKMKDIESNDSKETKSEDSKSDLPTKSLNKTKKTVSKTKEEKREESGEY